MTGKKKGSNRKKADEEGTPESAIPHFFEQMERQMEIWNEFMDSEDGRDLSQAGLDLAWISTKHMSDMMGRIGESLPEDMSAEEVFQKSKDIYLICAKSYSEMFKEAMATSSMPKQNAKMIDAFLNWKIETDRINQETLRSLGVPTHDDMDEIAEKLYWLDKKMDAISKELKQTKGRSRKSKSK